MHCAFVPFTNMQQLQPRTQVVSQIVDFLPLPNAIQACQAWIAPKDVVPVLSRHHSLALSPADMLNECVSLEQYPLLDTMGIDYIWASHDNRFPWEDLLLVSIARLNVQLAKYVLWSFDEMCPEHKKTKWAHGFLIHDINRRDNLLKIAGLGHVPLPPPSPELDVKTAVGKLWRSVTKVLLDLGSIDPLSLLNALCCCKHEHLDDWLAWYVHGFTVQNTLMPSKRAWTSTVDALVSLVASSSMQRLQTVLSSPWVHNKSIDFSRVLEAAIKRNNLRACAMLHQYVDVKPSEEHLKAMHPIIRQYFAYVLNPQGRNLTEDFHKLQQRLEETSKECVVQLAEMERQQVADLQRKYLESMQSVRQQFKQARAQYQTKFEKDAKRARTNYLLLSAVVSSC